MMAERAKRTDAAGNPWGAALRIGGALALLVFGTLSVGASLGQALAKPSPGLAHRLAPRDGMIAARLAEQEFLLAPTDDVNAPMVRLARRSLSQEPLAVKGLNVLGFNAQLRGDTAAAARLFGHSIELSRRELRPQLWRIEESVSQGDIPGALTSYDVALRTSAQAPGLLFPILAGALKEPKIRAALVDVFRADPPWESDFLDYAAGSNIDPSAANALFDALRGAKLGIPEGVEARLVSSFLANRQFDAAWATFARLRGGSDRRKIRNPDFRVDPADPTGFDWTVGEEPGISAGIYPSPDGGLVEFSSSATGSGAALKQLQHLPPGRYVLRGTLTQFEGSVQRGPYFSLQCVDGRDLGKIALVTGAGQPGPFAGEFSVPSNCQFQMLSLMLRQTNEISGLSGQVRRLVFTSAGTQ